MKLTENDKDILRRLGLYLGISLPLTPWVGGVALAIGFFGTALLLAIKRLINGEKLLQ